MAGEKSGPIGAKTNEFHMPPELGYDKEDKQTCLSVLLMYYCFCKAPAAEQLNMDPNTAALMR
jgi:hypothetical protein